MVARVPARRDRRRPPARVEVRDDVVERAAGQGRGDHGHDDEVRGAEDLFGRFGEAGRAIEQDAVIGSAERFGEALEAAGVPTAARLQLGPTRIVRAALLAGEVPFRAWTPKPVGEPQMLRQLANPEAARLVRRVLAAGIRAEGPIHRERLARLTASAFGVPRPARPTCW